MIIFTTVVIISIGSTNIIEDSNRLVLETNRQQVEDVANAAWVKAYGAGKITQQELSAAVFEALEKENVDIDKYNITITEDEVIVTIKDETED